MMNTLTGQQRKSSLLWDYLTTVDHKKIAILYMIARGFFFVVGGLEAMLIRIQLLRPGERFYGCAAV